MFSPWKILFAISFTVSTQGVNAFCFIAVFSSAIETRHFQNHWYNMQIPLCRCISIFFHLCTTWCWQGHSPAGYLVYLHWWKESRLSVPLDKKLYSTVAAKIRWFAFACDARKCAERIKVHAKHYKIRTKFAWNSSKIRAYFAHLSKKSRHELFLVWSIESSRILRGRNSGMKRGGSNIRINWVTLKIAFVIQQFWDMYMYAHFV